MGQGSLRRADRAYPHKEEGPSNHSRYPRRQRPTGQGRGQSTEDRTISGKAGVGRTARGPNTTGRASRTKTV